MGILFYFFNHKILIFFKIDVDIICFRINQLFFLLNIKFNRLKLLFKFTFTIKYFFLIFQHFKIN